MPLNIYYMVFYPVNIADFLPLYWKEVFLWLHMGEVTPVFYLDYVVWKRNHFGQYIMFGL